MQTGRNTQTLERFLLLEPLADRTQDGHLAFRPVDPAASAFSLVDVFDIVIAHDCSLLYCYPVGRVGKEFFLPVSRPTYNVHQIAYLVFSTLALAPGASVETTINKMYFA